MLKKILVPLDGSLRAERALPVAARIARASEGSVLLLQVVSPPIDYGSGLSPVPFVTGDLIEEELKEADSYLKTVATSSILAGIETSTEVLYGFAAQQLLTTAEEQSVDLIVMCSHGRTGLMRWVLGSVAHKLTHESTVPVVVLREKGGELASSQPDSRGRLTHAFVSLDGSELAEAVLRPATNLVLALSAPKPAVLHLMQVVKIFPSTEEQGALSELNQQAVEEANAYLATVKARLQQEFPEALLTITWSVTVENDIAGALIRTAEAQGEATASTEPVDCNVMAMSTHGRGGLQRWMIGSITERVLAATHLPMLIVRPKKPRSMK